MTEERLARLEEKVSHIETDVSEMKCDIKQLLQNGAVNKQRGSIIDKVFVVVVAAIVSFFVALFKQ